MSDAVSGRRIVGTLIATDIAFAFQQTAIVPAVHDVQQALHSTREWSAWLVTVYLIVATVATPALGRLGDLYGRRRMLLIGLAVFFAGSVGAALAPSMPLLICFRSLQGVGGAVYPLTLALARSRLRPERFGTAVALFAAGFGAGTVLGFALGGVLAQFASWRYVFVAGAVLVAVSFWLVSTGLPEAEQRATGKFDLLATLALSVSAASLLVALTLVVSLGWISPVVIALLALVAAASWLWLRLESRRPNPLVDLRVLRTRSVVLADLAAIAMGWALFGAYLLLPELERATSGQSGYGFGAGPALVGVLLLPLAAGQLVASLCAGRLADHFSPRRLSVAGLLVLTAALAALAVVNLGIAAYVPTLFVFGIGAGLTLQASSAVATLDIHADLAAVSSAVNSTLRRLGGGVGGQVATILLASLTLDSKQLPSTTAFTISFAVAAGLCLIASAAFILPERGAAESQEHAATVSR